MTLTRLAVCIITGMLPLLVLAKLPDQSALAGITLAALLLMLKKSTLTWCLATALLSFVWGAWNGQNLLKNTIQFSRQPVILETRIIGVDPDKQRLKVQLLADKEQIIFPPVFAWIKVKYSQQGHHWCAGQRAWMKLRLNPVHAQLNQGTFDSQRFALGLRTTLSGRVISAHPITTDCSLRHQLIERARPLYQMLNQSSLLSALAFGERGELTASMRQLLRNTGIAHLMAISGMHIGLAAICGSLLIRLVQISLPSWRIDYRWPLIFSWAVALLYCWLSGAQPPAQRAMLALSLWIFLRLRGIYVTPWQVWLFCVASLLVVDPVTVLSDSFWLSVLAVATLFVGYRLFPLPTRFVGQRRWFLLRLLHLQIIMTLLFMPVQIVIFNGISLTALVANIWAIPWVSAITVPLILIALLLLFWPAASALFWKMANLSLNGVIIPLNTLPEGWLPVDRFWLTLLLVFMWAILSWHYYLWHLIPCTIVALFFILFVSRLASTPPRWRLDMLDIGHGLAVVISRQGHAVLYDSGGRWPTGNAGERTITPWLHWQGLTPDILILSHRHLDHVGGAESLLTHWPGLLIRSNFQKTGAGCNQGMRWRWHGLQFEVLWPPPGHYQGDNNDSCVLLIDDGKHKVLLTGDIEHPVEQRLAATWRERGAITLIQVPHHGSSTSSGALLLRRLQGKYALASVARYSAWKLPAPSVVTRYQTYSYIWHDTARSGQISVDFFSDSVQVRGLREHIVPRWYHQWFGVPGDSR
ncbi:DNA internalization-related competence protein ComEC/Rec2 [Enterobacteriaceae bacterium LUAb1]